MKILKHAVAFSGELLNDGRGVRMPPAPLNCFALSFLIVEAVDNMPHHWENYRELKV